MANQIWTCWDTATVVVDEPENNYYARTITQEDGIATALIKYRCEGLTME